ncbi:MAG: 4Fe-4S dicluster domain-containing protein [Candidatus Geothermarchaeales archaeon]
MPKKTLRNFAHPTYVEKPSVDGTLLKKISFREEIRSILGGERVSYCFQCGICTGVCPSARFSKVYNPRTIILRSLLGGREQVVEDKTLWLCAECHSCEEFCPQDVHIYSALTAIRNIATGEGNAPRPFFRNAKILADTGRIASMMGVNKLREKVGLRPLEELESSDVIKIMKVTGFDRFFEAGGAK